MEITNKEEYKHIYWTVEYNGVEYNVQMVENYILDDWYVLNAESGDVVEEGTDLWKQLVAFCQKDLRN